MLLDEEEAEPASAPSWLGVPAPQEPEPVFSASDMYNFAAMDPEQLASYQQHYYAQQSHQPAAAAAAYAHGGGA